MITAVCVNNKIVITISLAGHYRLERKKYNSENWLVYTAAGFDVPTEENPALSVDTCNILDVAPETNTLYQYRYCDFDLENPTSEDFTFSEWVKCGESSAIGYSFGNYKVPEGKWGQVITPDDLRYTYLWGTDFKATNGQSYKDEQIQFFIDAAVEEIERKLDISIKKRRIRCNAEMRNMQKGVDYDVEESFYDFKFQKISRYGIIRTRQRPIAKLHSLKLIKRGGNDHDVTQKVVVDKQKGTLKLIERPIKPSDMWSGIATAINPYGNQSLNPNMFYQIDYDAGYETSDEVPSDLRQIIGKQCAISLLNIIGDGLMSGFSSSSLSMDGLSESFSSTQSATSAYFGARIKEYKDDIEAYIKENKFKFNNLPMGSI